MRINNIHIQNFKSINDVSVDFTPLTMIVGPNAAGKSNLINAFRFIQDILKEGIDNAIALQGGMPYVVNSNNRNDPLIVEFTLDLSEEMWRRSVKKNQVVLEVETIDCSFAIQPHKKGSGYRIAHDHMNITYSCYRKNNGDIDSTRYRYSREYERKSSKSKMTTTYRVLPDDQPDDALYRELIDCVINDQNSLFYLDISSDFQNELMLAYIFYLLPPYSFSNLIRIYDFDPKEIKKSSSIASPKSLLENGSNIATVLSRILRNNAQKKKLLALIGDFLPSVDSVSVENNPDKSVSYKIKECYNSNPYYANFLSDGTVSILAIIIALYFEDNGDIIVLEEPERNIHPKLLAQLLSAAEDVSDRKQIIITTHNPEFLKHASIENVKLVIRDQTGYTRVENPENDKAINNFMKNDLGLDELFLLGILG